MRGEHAPLPTKDGAERDPEELSPLVVERVAKVEGLEQVDDGDVRRVERVCRVDEQLAENTGDTISDHLAGEDLEDGDSGAQANVVEEVQSCDDLHGHGYRGRCRGHDYDRSVLYRGMSWGSHAKGIVSGLTLDIEGTRVEVAPVPSCRHDRVHGRPENIRNDETEELRDGSVL